MQAGKGRELIVVVGPTATGKSTLAARLAARMGGEVVSADSVQVYKYFNVGAGKPSAEELSLAPHHLIDVADPLEPIEANVWARMAREKIDEISERGAVPIICGGTFLYVRALVYGLADAPAGDAQIRALHQSFAEEEGRAALHEKLRQVDPESAERLHPNDFVRVSRALEVYELTGRKMSAIFAEHGFATRQFNAHYIAVDWPREEYEARLRARISSMMQNGFVDEVRDLRKKGYAQARAMGSVGYRQLNDALAGGGTVDVEALAEQVIAVSRIFARRQRTWLREEKLTMVDPAALSHPEALAALAEELVRGIQNS